MRRLVESGRKTADIPPEFVFYIDDDDTNSVDTANELGVRYIVGPRIVLSEMWNVCAREASHDILMQCGDDIVFQTDHWDTLVLEEFDKHADKIVLVHGRDGFQDAALATHGFLHRKWMDTVGYFVPPYFSSDYNDLWLTEVADMLGRCVYLPDVYTEHMHPVVGKASMDSTHQERLIRHVQDRVDQIYAGKLNERTQDAAKLRSVIDSHGGAS